MANKTSALSKRDLFDLGWKALVAELGVANAARFLMELGEGEGDYTQLRRELFEGKKVDELYDEVRKQQKRRGSTRAVQRRRRNS